MSNEAIRNLMYNASEAQRVNEDGELYVLDHFNPYLETRATSEQRKERALRLIHVSREREEKR